MKKKKDPGLIYLQSLNLKPVKTKKEFMETLVKNAGSDVATAIFEELDRRAQGIMKEEYFYELKNTDLKTSMTFSGALDGDIIRKGCNWVAENRDLFGKRILDVGCDCGLMSCFLATALPDSEILSIDLSQAALDNAKELAGHLGLTNITFAKKDVRKLLAGDQYDTVFAMRALIPNLTVSGQEDSAWELEEAGDYFAGSCGSYARALADAVRDGGSLVTIEKIEKNGFLLGWLKALENSGLALDMDSWEEMACKELATNSVLQAIACRKMPGGPSAADVFINMYETLTDFSQANYEGWMAKTAIYLQAGSLIRGFRSVDQEKGVVTKVALYGCKADASLVMLAQYIGEFYQVSLFSRDSQKELIENLKVIEDGERKRPGVTVTALKDTSTPSGSGILI